MRLGLIVCVALLGLAVAAQGNVVSEITNLGMPYISDGTTVYETMPGYTAYLITLVSDGAPITGIDMNGTAERGLFGTVSQHWTYTGTYSKTYYPTVYSTIRNGELDGNSFDTHLLFNAGALITVGAQEEDNSKDNQSGGEAFGTGTYLRGAFGLPSNLVSTSVPLLYVVVADGTLNSLTGIAQVAVQGSATTYDVPLIPEPASLSLLALAGLAVLRRR